MTPRLQVSRTLWVSFDTINRLISTTPITNLNNTQTTNLTMSTTTPQQPPDLNIPYSTSTVSISIIDTTAHLSLPASMFMEPQVPGYNTLTAPCYVFLIKHTPTNPTSTSTPSKHNTLLFDLGVRLDWQNSPTPVVEMVRPHAHNLHITKDVATILCENNQPLDKIGAIIWSHAHFDHTGDPATFPPTTDLIVGPGFRAASLPAWPSNQTSPIDERAWQGRTLREIDFEAEGNGLRIGKFAALDFYGDGSFYLLDTPGHADGHMCALARTTAEPEATFVFLGGDVAHQAGEFRPTVYLPLPERIEPSPHDAPFSGKPSFCPGEIFQAIHPRKSRTEPFFKPATAEDAPHLDAAEAKRSIDKMTEFDACEDVFSVIAHDQSLFDVVDFYPKLANEWKAKGWGREGRWRFLNEFDVEKGEGTG